VTSSSVGAAVIVRRTGPKLASVIGPARRASDSAGSLATMIVLLHQDWPGELDGLRLAVASLRRHCPDLPVLASCPRASKELSQWLRERCAAGVHTGDEFADLGWNVKPKLLRWALELGHQQVLWLDADVVAAADFRLRLPPDGDVFVAAEEFAWGQLPGSAARTAAWGLPVGRVLERTANTGVVRVSRSHRALLEDWDQLLVREDYRTAQQEHATARPLHLVSDQDALTALLGSAAYADLPLHLLRRGRDIAQCAGPSGFTPGERIVSLWRGLPPLIHAVGVKPWHHGAYWRYDGGRLARLRASYEDLHSRLSPYTVVACGLAEEAGVSVESYRPRTAAERVILRWGRRWPQLPELPLALGDTAVRWIRKVVAIGRYRHSPTR